MEYENVILKGHALEVLRQIPDAVVQTCITSPPYYNLRDYGHGLNVKWSDGWDGQLGHEPTPELFVEHLVDIFREVKRVLRDDGTCWIVIGDSYAGSGGTGTVRSGISHNPANTEGFRPIRPPKPTGKLKPKDLTGVPWMLAFAMRDDGWYFRSDIIWQKRNPMPENVNDRPVCAHEHILFFAKSRHYFFDTWAIREGQRGFGEGDMVMGHNRTNVWDIKTKPIAGLKHWAVFPDDIPELAIKAGTSERNCRVCGKGWVREIKRTKANREDRKDNVNLGGLQRTPSQLDRKYIGEYECDCEHESDGWGRALVLDPFMGSGTSAIVAKRLRRDYLGAEINEEYIKRANERLKFTVHDTLMKWVRL